MRQLTEAQRELMRQLIRRSPALVGRHVVVHDDYTEVDDSWELGYATLAVELKGIPEHQWPDVVDDYLRRFAARMSEGPDGDLNGPTESFLDRIYARVVPVEGLPEVPEYATEIAPGLVRLLVLDQPDSMRFLTAEHVARHGLDRLLAAGLRNLPAQLQTAAYADNQGVHLLEGSEYVGSLVLVLADVIEAVTGAPPPSGALVAMPGRDQLMLHVVADDETVWHARDEITALAFKWHAENAHQLSPWVYWWRPDGSLETIDDSDDFADAVLTLAEERLAESIRWEQLRRMVRRSPALSGMRVEMHDEYVSVIEPKALGRIEFGFLLTGELLDVPAEQWQAVVDDFLSRQVALRTAGIPTDDGTVLERTYLGIFADADPPPKFSYAPVVAPGLVRPFVYAQPELVSLLTNEHVLRHGADRLYEAGLRNLERELEFEVSSQDGVFQLDGSMFTAATVFLLPEVIARTTGESTLPDGVLVSFPLQTTLLYHVPGTDDWDNALRTMFGQTRARFEDGPDPDVLSPYLYWWRAGELTQITGDSDDDELKVYVSGEFEKVVQRFAG